MLKNTQIFPYTFSNTAALVKASNWVILFQRIGIFRFSFTKACHVLSWNYVFSLVAKNVYFVCSLEMIFELRKHRLKRSLFKKIPKNFFKLHNKCVEKNNIFLITAAFVTTSPLRKKASVFDLLFTLTIFCKYAQFTNKKHISL